MDDCFTFFFTFNFLLFFSQWQVPNRDLLHAVVALYDVSLPDVGEEFLYATVCAKWSKTILMLRDSGEVVEELCKSHPAGGTSATSSTQDSGIADGDTGQQGGRGAEEKKEDEDKRRFADVFSDSDSSEGSSSESEEEEDFSAGADDFVQRVRERRQQRRDGRLQPSQGNLGIESRLLSCATFERSYCKGEKVVQLHLIAVRRRYRKWGMGRYLLKQVKHPPVVGTYDYLIVHADSSATDFFERFGFSDDVVLNSRFSEFDEQWTNTTMMCYIPPYAGLNGMSSDPELDLKAMELEIRKLC
ncbi:Hypp6995 [Branchiostoma lanceolatum]|uniref:Hypp6995 protein n=1 Tax=Branchiostoma lanceolatum TaxID=7740 RepID=A0A8J9YW86_BRALA|nr:Hypp6995 [Branchiostoma lanceolatum]